MQAKCLCRTTPHLENPRLSGGPRLFFCLKADSQPFLELSWPKMLGLVDFWFRGRREKAAGYGTGMPEARQHVKWELTCNKECDTEFCPVRASLCY